MTFYKMGATCFTMCKIENHMNYQGQYLHPHYNRRYRKYL